MGSRSRDYCFTFYPEGERELYTNQKAIRYMIYGVEKCPTTGRTHYQGYCYFRREVSWKIAQESIANYSLHVEECKGEREDNIHYCMKGEQSKEEWDKFKEKGVNWGKNSEVYEFGDKPKQGKRQDIHRVKKQIENNVPLKEIIRDENSYQACRMAELKYKYCENKRPIKNIEVIWIYGGTARERKLEAYREEEELFTPISDKWWDGYDMDKTVLIEEYDKSYCSTKRLDQLTDIFPFRVETKGGSRQVQYNKIIFTCKDYPMVDKEVLERLSVRNLHRAEVGGNTSPDYNTEKEIKEYWKNSKNVFESHGETSDEYDDWSDYEVEEADFTGTMSGAEGAPSSYGTKITGDESIDSSFGPSPQSGTASLSEI